MHELVCSVHVYVVCLCVCMCVYVCVCVPTSGTQQLGVAQCAAWQAPTHFINKTPYFSNITNALASLCMYIIVAF
jgi:hypothetical protein